LECGSGLSNVPASGARLSRRARRVKTRRFAPALAGAFGGLDADLRAAQFLAVAAGGFRGRHVGDHVSANSRCAQARSMPQKAARNARAERSDVRAERMDGAEHSARILCVIADRTADRTPEELWTRRRTVAAQSARATAATDDSKRECERPCDLRTLAARSADGWGRSHSRLGPLSDPEFVVGGIKRRPLFGRSRGYRVLVTRLRHECNADRPRVLLV